MVQGEINRGKHTDHPAGHHSIQTNHCSSAPHSPYFLQAGCPSYLPKNGDKALKAINTEYMHPCSYKVINYYYYTTSI